MNDNQEGSPIAALFAASSMMGKIESLEKQLESANKHIEYLQGELANKAAEDIAESCFGYQDARHVRYDWGNETLPPIAAKTFVKTNTKILTDTMVVRQDFIEIHYQRPERLEDMVKDKLLSDMFCTMQGLKLFKFHQKRLKFETLFTAAIEVAR